MRIRQVKPSFWTDATIAQVSYQARLFYIGLWCVADDAGYIEWRPVELGALLFPYEAPRARERHISAWTDELTASGRLSLNECGCAVIPTMPLHQRIAGKQAFTVRDKHDRLHRGKAPTTARDSGPVTSRAQKASAAASVSEQIATGGYQVLTDSPGNGTVGNGKERNGSATRDVFDTNDATSDFRRLVPRPGAAA